VKATWRRRLVIGAIAMLTVVGSVVVSSGHDAWAEAQLGTTIPVGSLPEGIAVNPATNRIYVANRGSASVSVIDGATNKIAAKPIDVGPLPTGIAVNPVTNRIYVTLDGNNAVAVIDGETNAVIGSRISVGKNPESIDVNPMTNRVYVANSGDNNVTVIDGATNAVVGLPVPVGSGPFGVAVNLMTNRVYVVNGSPGADKGSVSVIDGSNNAVIGPPIEVGKDPFSIAVNPAINRIYVANGVADSLSEIDGAANTIIGTIFPIPGGIGNVAVNPANGRVYVVSLQGHSVTVIDGVTNAVIGTPISVGNAAEGVGFNPVTGRIYVGTQDDSVVSVIGVPFSVTSSTTSPGKAITATWSSLFGSDGRDFVGFFESGAPNTAPLTKSFTTGQATGGSGLADGSIGLAIPSGLVAGRAYEVRLVSGLSGGTLAQVAIVPPQSVAAPVGANDAYTVAENGLLNVPAPGVLANDTDADSPSLQATLETAPTHGTFSLQPSGAFTYKPNENFTGTDRFTYRATDQTNLSAPVTVTITVTPTGADPVVACTPRPPVKVTQAVSGGKLSVHIQATSLSAQQPNTLHALHFGTLQNGNVTLNGQPIASGQTFTVPPGSNAIDFAVERATRGQATTVPLTIVDGCGEWPTFVGGGTDAGF
jgi:YVTN family beta-propeller protein/VCBS repeat-containing protein